MVALPPCSNITNDIEINLWREPAAVAALFHRQSSICEPEAKRLPAVAQSEPVVAAAYHHRQQALRP